MSQSASSTGSATSAFAATGSSSRSGSSIVVGLTVAVQIAGKQTSDNLTLPGTGSTKATNLLAAKLPKQQNGTVPIVFVATVGQGRLGREQDRDQQGRQGPGDATGVEKATNPLSSKDADAVSKDKTIAYSSLTLSAGPGDLTRTRRTRSSTPPSRRSTPGSTSPPAATWASRSPSRRPSRARRSGSRWP